MKENVKKIGIYFSESRIYSFARKIYLLILSAFEETFFYKLFFKKIRTDLYEESFFGRLFGFLKNILAKTGDLINKILKRDENTAYSATIKDIVSTSVFLRIFKMNEYKQSFVFLIFLALFISAGILPTMVVIGLCLITAVSMFFDKKFSMNVRASKPIITDMLIFLYLFALFYSRWISIDVQKNKIFLVYFVFVGFYFVIKFFISNEDRLYLALHSFSLSALFVCLVGAFQFVTGSYKTSDWTDTRIFEEIEGRLVATFENPNVFGEYLLIVIPIIIAMFFVSKTKLWKVVYALLFVLAMGCMVLTYSRGCWLGIIFAIIIFVVMAYPKAILPACMVAPLSVFFIPQSIIERITSIGNMQDGSTIFRVFLWQSTVDMLKEYWASGIGLGTDCYEKIYSRYAYDTVLAPHSHNTFLHVMGESGVFGLVVYVLILYFVFRQLFIAYSNTKNKNLKIIASAFVAAFSGAIIQGMFDNLFYNYRLYMMFFAAISISCVIYEIYLKEVEKS